MKLYESFQIFWNEFSTQPLNSHGFTDWLLVDYIHTSDRDYAQSITDKTNELGYQPLGLTLVNPFSSKIKKYMIKNVNDDLIERFLYAIRNQYQEQFGNRFGSFMPDVTEAFAEYEDWQDFYSHWIERDGKQVFNINVPLLFDHTPKLEYWSRKKNGEKVLAYQRLYISTYFVTKKRFFTFFIKNISDEDAQKIRMLMQSRIGLNIDNFLVFNRAKS